LPEPADPNTHVSECYWLLTLTITAGTSFIEEAVVDQQALATGVDTVIAVRYTGAIHTGRVAQRVIGKTANTANIKGSTRIGHAIATLAGTATVHVIQGQADAAIIGLEADII